MGILIPNSPLHDFLSLSKRWKQKAISLLSSSNQIELTSNENVRHSLGEFPIGPFCNFYLILPYRSPYICR